MKPSMFLWAYYFLYHMPYGLLDNYQPHESCPEVDGATYRPEVYKIPKVRMFEI